MASVRACPQISKYATKHLNLPKKLFSSFFLQIPKNQYIQGHFVTFFFVANVNI